MMLHNTSFSCRRLLALGLLAGSSHAAMGQILDVDGNPNAGFAGLYAWYEGAAFAGLDGIAETPLWINSQGDDTRDITSGFPFGGPPALTQVYFGNGNQGARFQNVVAWRNGADWGVLNQPITIFAVTSFGSTTDSAIWGDNTPGTGSSGLFADAVGGSFNFGSNTGSTINVGSVPANTIQVHSWVINGNSSEHFINGASQGTVNTGTGQLNGFVIAGKEGGFATADDITYGDLLVYSNALSASNRQAVEGFLTDRYLNNPVGDIRNWASANATDTFGNSSAWSAAGTPAAGWDANVQSSKTQDQVAQVAANRTVQYVNIAGNVEVTRDEENNTIDATPRNMTLEVLAGNTLTATNGMSVRGGGILSGSGTVAADVLVEGGSVNPGASPGVLNIDGDYTQRSSGVYTVELEGTTVGTEHDQIAIDGKAQLAGFLNIELLDGYRPDTGTDTASYVILTATEGVTGDFGNFDPQTLLDQIGIGFSIDVQADRVILNADAVFAPGDANQDGTVDFADFSALSGSFGEEGTAWATGDFNGDGETDFADFSALSGNFGSTDGPQPPAQGAVPEPTSLALLGLGGLLLARRRRA